MYKEVLIKKEIERPEDSPPPQLQASSSEPCDLWEVMQLPSHLLKMYGRIPAIQGFECTFPTLSGSRSARLQPMLSYSPTAQTKKLAIAANTTRLLLKDL